MTYKKFKEETKEKFNQLFEDYGIFWAFDNKQFEENKTPLEEGDKYVQLGAGGFMPKSKVKEFKKAKKEFFEKYWKTIEENNWKELEILYELRNHECFYTGDIEDALEVLPYGKDEVMDVYLKHRKNEE